MKITTAAEMRDIDRLSSEQHGVPSHTLMENAGAALARFAISKFPKAWRFTIFCGKGNNGGDGFVAARKLGHEGRRVVVVLLADPSELKGDAAEMFRTMGLDPLVVRSAEDLKREQVTLALKADVLIDAMLGTGFRPPVAGIYADAIKLINATKKPIIAVDIPSGADADAYESNDSGDQMTARADHIVTFTAPRPAHVFGGLTRGDTLVAPIGSPDAVIKSSLNLQVIAPRDFAQFLADRDPEGHKGTYGHALVIGGSFGKAGAAAMSGMAALRSGAGLATIATPKSVLNTVAGFATEIMTEPLPETDHGTISPHASGDGRMAQVLEGKDVVALGPGIGRYPATVQFAQSFAADCKLPLVIDADGLNAFDGHTDKLSGADRPLVLTPHPGEMSRLTGLSTKEIQQDRIGVARKFATEHKCILVLKGHRTLVALPDGAVWANATGNPGMATGGTGDVLTGMIAGSMAQTAGESSASSFEGDNPWAHAVLAAVYLHGLAGDIAREKMGEASMIAGDLLVHLPEAFKRAKMQLWAKGFVFHG